VDLLGPGGARDHRRHVRVLRTLFSCVRACVPRGRSCEFV
jgi:hypothetical protein